MRRVSPRVVAAFGGDDNLHVDTEDIARLKAAYDALGRDAAARDDRWSR